MNQETQRDSSLIYAEQAFQDGIHILQGSIIREIQNLKQQLKAMVSCGDLIGAERTEFELLMAEQRLSEI